MNLKIGLIIYFITVMQIFHNCIFAQNNFLIFSSKNAPFPSNRPSNITQDRDGSYWVTFYPEYLGGSYVGGGLTRFDGVNWQVYTKENSPLPTNQVNAIAVDSLGRKWIATDSGVVKFDGINWTIYNIRNSPLMENSIWNINVERDTIIWISSYSTGYYKFDGLNWFKYNKSNSPLYSDKTNFVVIEKSGIKWFGADYSPLFSFDGTNWQLHGKYPFAPGPGGFANPDVRSMVIDKNNVKWLAGPGYWGSGIPRYFAIAKFIDTNWTIYDSSTIGFQPYLNYSGIAIDSNNIKWFTDWKNGLIRYNDTSFVLFNQTNSPIRKSNCIIVDRFNNKVFTAELNEQSSTGEYLWGVVFYNENGVVLTSVKDRPPQPSQFYLFQNYPNPFNALTTIMFSISDSDLQNKNNPGVSKIESNQHWRVTLKIYDVLGREIATPIDEYKTPGSYEVKFQSETLPSGTYFYQLRAGTFVETKKMIIIK